MARAPAVSARATLDSCSSSLPGMFRVGCCDLAAPSLVDIVDCIMIVLLFTRQLRFCIDQASVSHHVDHCIQCYLFIKLFELDFFADKS